MSFRFNNRPGRGGNRRLRGKTSKLFRNKRGNNNWSQNGNKEDASLTTAQVRKQRLKEKLEKKKRFDSQDEMFGFTRYESGPSILGWLLNMEETVVTHSETGEEQAAIDFYFIKDDGLTFKATTVFYPYFYLSVTNETDSFLHSMEQFLRQKFDQFIYQIEFVSKIDLSQKNHLSGIAKKFLKIIFLNDSDMRQVSRVIKDCVMRNKSLSEDTDAIVNVNGDFELNVTSKNQQKQQDLMNSICGIFEYDVLYITRVCIDLDVRIGKWFEILPKEHGVCQLKVRNDLEHRPEAKIFAFDIETTKAPLKFPNSEFDQIMMISYMIDNDGFLIVNREIVGEDIEDFEYTPKKEFEGRFTIFNEKDEWATLSRFFEHIRDTRPNVYVTYNGDFFDWPFIEKRADVHGMDMAQEIGVYSIRGTYCGRFVVNLDCFEWVQRDSYLPQGSQNLKAVTRYKLGYNPVELDPEDMLPYAQNKPQELATYSVSDAVATYYLFKKYIQNFIFSLCQIIPLNSGDVLRKGSGTLCEGLLMVQAFSKNIICPNKQGTNEESFSKLEFYKNKYLLESETYIGGHVESFESGVFRKDIAVKFNINPSAIDELINDIADTVKFSVEIEHKRSMDEVTNFEQVCQEIKEKLLVLKNNGRIEIEPLIYHLDVAAMYPNIILTNRLQPVAVVNEETCAACDFNRPGKQCQRELDWKWRGKYFPASKGEIRQIQQQLETESFESKKLKNLTWRQLDTIKKMKQLDNNNNNNNWNNNKNKNNKNNNNNDHLFSFAELTPFQQNELLVARVKDYCQKVYKKQTVEKEEDRKSVICQRENGFYVDTVRAFRDRRYEYKGKTRMWKIKSSQAKSEVEKSECLKNVTLYDSLQLAHKCILNSFYGYVMRRGARWYSMDMAAITTNIGANIIKDAHNLCQHIGRPIELDTDGIWCMLPCNFPENFVLTTTNPNPKKSKIIVEYPCSMLNLRTHRNYTNHQFQVLTNAMRKEYSIHSECSIFFEVDGPYRCMVLPASTEENRRLKKRYAVFNDDGSIAELKGFEIKRRGELKMIKIFQQEVFKTFLKGKTLPEVYEFVASVGQRWLNILDTKANELSNDELFDLITESKSMSKTVDDYGDSRSTSLTCAKRLAQFLGESMIKDSGLTCKFVISQKPIGCSVSDRAIPVAIFSAEPAIMKQYLKRWLNDYSMTSFDIRSILDWDYYRKRMGQQLQKIITIPAAMQHLKNPIPQLAHPSWLQKRINNKNDPYQQRNIKDFFSKQTKTTSKPQRNAISYLQDTSNDNSNDIQDIEDIENIVGMANDNSNDIRMTMERQEQKMVEEKKEEKKEELVDIDDDFDTWLRQSKQIWTKLKECRPKRNKKTRKRGIGDIDNDNNNNNNNSQIQKRARFGNDNNGFDMNNEMNYNNNDMARFFETSNDDLYNYPWQIIQIVPLDIPGRFILWVYVDCHNGQRVKLQAIKLTVKRHFYVNVIKLNEFEDLLKRGKLVKRVLPRNRRCYNLIELIMNEKDFLKQQKEIGTLLTHPWIEGVYEIHVPLLFRIISRLGCCCRVNGHSNARQNHLNEFELSDLSFVTTDACHYMAQECFNFNLLNNSMINKKLNYIYFYHSQSSGNQRSIFGLIESSHRKENLFNCTIIVVNPFKKSKIEDVKLSQYSKMLFCQAFGQENESQFELKIKSVEIEKSLEDGYRAVNKYFDNYQSSLYGKHSNTIVLSQTKFNNNSDFGEFYSHFSILRESLPLIQFSFNENENDYPSLHWYTFATKMMINQFFTVGRQLHDNMELSRYAHIPVGNIPCDINTWFFVADTFYSRLLSDNQHLWWMSGTPINGNKYSNSNSGNNGMNANSENIILENNNNIESMFEDEHGNPMINNGGFYNTMCFDLTISHLAVNALVSQSDDLANDLFQECNIANDGNNNDNNNNNSGDDDNDDTNMETMIHDINAMTIDDMSSVYNAFKILKTLVKAWFADVTNYGDRFADGLLVHFYRWIRNNQSFFNDPLLHKMIHKIMEKIFLRLLKQFENLGCSVVFASFNNILIETKKHGLTDTYAYVVSIIETIKKDEMFEWLTIRPHILWECLLWYDNANFGGLLLIENGNEINNNMPSYSDYERVLESQWNIGTFLPTKCEDVFESIIGEYIMTMHKKYRKLLSMTGQYSNEFRDLLNEDEKEEGKRKEENEKKKKREIEKRKQEKLQKLRRLRKKEKEKEKEKAKEKRKGRKKKIKAGKREIDDDDDDDDDSDNEDGDNNSEDSDDEIDLDLDGSELDLDLDLDIDDFDNDNNNNNNKTNDNMNEMNEMNEMKQESRNEEMKEITVDEAINELNQFRRQWTQVYLSKKLFGHVLQIHKKLRADTNNENEKASVFPDRPGSHLPLQIPSLEFIKSICQILSLDSVITEDVSVLKKNLLKMIDIRDFSELAKFENPCLTYVLTDVNCHKCRESRDVDLCRDWHTLPHHILESYHDDDDNNEENKDETWNIKCHSCKTIYNRDMVESMLLQVVRRRQTAYHMQDVLCTQCGKAKMDQMSEYCSCSGTYTNKQSKNHFIKNMTVFENIAKYYGFEFLNDTLHWILHGHF